MGGGLEQGPGDPERLTRYDDYAALHALEPGTVVQDAAGEVWYVKKYERETWLCPFSDEYSFTIKADGSTSLPWRQHLPEAPLPITDLGIKSSGGA